MADLPRLTLINPTTNRSVLGNQGRVLQQAHITLDSIVKLWEGLEISSKRTQGIHSLFSKILLNNALRGGIVKCQHTAAGMLHDQDLIRTQKLLGDDNGSQGVFGIATGIANDMGVAKINTICCGRVDSSIHASYNKVIFGWWESEGAFGER